MNTNGISKYHRNRGRRRGVAFVYISLIMLMLVGITSYCVDMSWLYSRKAVAQKAADAAALAGAYQLAQGNAAAADPSARQYAAYPENGGYNDGDNPETLVIENTTPTASTESVTIGKWNPALAATSPPQAVAHRNWYKVTVSRPEPTFFARIFGAQFRRIRVGATATALYETNAELNIKGVGTYGVAPGPVNLSLFGPDGQYNNGDRYSVRKLANKTDNNPDYNGVDANIPEAEKGYSFSINLNAAFRSSYTRAYLQIFDPDCYNKNGNADADGTNTIDELRNPSGGTGSSTNATTTKFKLWYDPDGDGPSAEAPVPGGEKSYGGNATDATTDMKWNDFFSADLATFSPTGRIRLQVISTAGSSENGFDLRVSQAAVPTSGTDPFNTSNGSNITAQGHLPINFNQGGSTVLTLGHIPAEAAGGSMTITKFDTDVTQSGTANTVYYKCNPPAPGQPANGFIGKLSGQGEYVADTLQLPANYAGGVWTATYTAGQQDTSVWDMSYSNSGPGRPGRIRLIK